VRATASRQAVPRAGPRWALACKRRGTRRRSPPLDFPGSRHWARHDGARDRARGRGDLRLAADRKAAANLSPGRCPALPRWARAPRHSPWHPAPVSKTASAGPTSAA
jgi:hypothetical protein